MKCSWHIASKPAHVTPVAVNKGVKVVRCGVPLSVGSCAQRRYRQPLSGTGAGLHRLNQELASVQHTRQRLPSVPTGVAGTFGDSSSDDIRYASKPPLQMSPLVQAAVDVLSRVPFVGAVLQSGLRTIHRFQGLWGTFLPMVTLFFLMAFVNTVLDSLKDTLVITASGGGAEVIPYLSVYAVLPLSVIFLVAYSFASQVLSRQALFNGIIGTFMAFFTVFALFLYPNHDALHLHAYADSLQQVVPSGLSGLVGMIRNWTFTLFFCMAELWGDVGLSLLFWGLANDTTGLRDAPVLYPFFGLGANVAQTVAGTLLREFSGSSQSFGTELQAIMSVVLFSSAAILALHAYISHQANVKKNSDGKSTGVQTASPADSISSTGARSTRNPTVTTSASVGTSSLNGASSSNGIANGVNTSNGGMHDRYNGRIAGTPRPYSDTGLGGSSRGNASGTSIHSADLERAARTAGGLNGHHSAVQPSSASLRAGASGNGVYQNGHASEGFHLQNGHPTSGTSGYKPLSPASTSSAAPGSLAYQGLPINGHAKAQHQQAGAPGAGSAAERSGGQTSTSAPATGTTGSKGAAEKKLSVREVWAVLIASIEIRCLALMSIAQGLCTSLMEFTWKCHISVLYPSPSDMTAFLGDVAVWTGIVTGTLMLLSPLLFERLGWRGVAVATPQMMLWGGGAFFALCIAFQHFYAGVTSAALSSVAGVVVLKTVVFGGAALFVLSKGAKFSLFKPAEEMIYIAMDEQGRTKGKAAIDVVGAQAGKSAGSVLQQGLLILSSGTLMGIVPAMAAVCMFMLLAWQTAVHQLADAKGMDRIAHHGASPPPESAAAQPAVPVSPAEPEEDLPSRQALAAREMEALRLASLKFRTPKNPPGGDDCLQPLTLSRLPASA